MVDPFDTDALGQAIARVVDDADFRDVLRARGLEQARKFSWRETARLTLEAYKRAARRD